VASVLRVAQEMSTHTLIERNSKIVLSQKGRALLNKLHKSFFQLMKWFETELLQKSFILFYLNIIIFL